MHPAFSHHATFRPIRLAPSVETPGMTARRPGTSSYGFSFRYGNLFSRAGNNNRLPGSLSSRVQQNGVGGTHKTVGDEHSSSSYSQNTIVASGARRNRRPFRVDPTKSTNLNDTSRSVPFNLPFLGTIRVPGTIVLMFVPLLWSSYSIIVKWLYRLPWAVSPVFFNFLRLLVGSIMLLPAFTPKTITKPVLKAGAELGFWTVLANTLQITGLRFTTASRAAFLSQLSTVLVPLIAVAVGMESRLAPAIILSAPLSMLGVALLTLDGAAPSIVGDSIMITVAFVTAAYILRSKRYSNLPSATLVASKTIFQTLFAGLLLLFTPTQPFSFVGATPLWLVVNAAFVLYAGFFIGYLSTSLQIRGQGVVSPSEAAVIFTSNPLWAALLAIPLGERFGPKGFAGASVILLANALASGIFTRQKPQKKIPEVG